MAGRPQTLDIMKHWLLRKLHAQRGRGFDVLVEVGRLEGVTEPEQVCVLVRDRVEKEVREPVADRVGLALTKLASGGIVDVALLLVPVLTFIKHGPAHDDACSPCNTRIADTLASVKPTKKNLIFAGLEAVQR